MAAAIEPTPSRLCPQPWPGAPSSIAFCSAAPASWLSPGRASNSPRKPITGPPSPKVPEKAVLMPAKSRSTRNPSCSSARQNAWAAKFSWKPTSGCSHSASLSPHSCSRRSSIADNARCFFCSISIRSFLPKCRGLFSDTFILFCKYLKTCFGNFKPSVFHLPLYCQAKSLIERIFFCFDEISLCFLWKIPTPPPPFFRPCRKAAA